MTYSQIAWAKDHDWFLSEDSFSITVRDDMEKDKEITFTDFSKPYSWSGY